MRSSARNQPEESLLGFGFVPDESTHHFLVTIPAGNRQDVLISEHYTWQPDDAVERITFSAGVDDGKLRAFWSGKDGMQSPTKCAPNLTAA
jgi:hypothetical protein